MNTVSVNLALPTDLYNHLLVFVSNIKKVNSNDFIIEAIKQRLKSEKKRLNALLVEGYQATATEDLKITKEFESADFEKNKLT